MEYIIGTNTNPGKNSYNEDRCVALKSLPEDATSAFFAVYDGHGGTEASTYCQKHMHTVVCQQTSYASNKKLALTEGFKAVDKKFIKKLEDSGCTAVTVLITDNGKRLYCANAGDSRAVLCSGGKAVALSEDHKPSNPIETKRIKAADHTVEIETALVDGKRIQIARVDGQIAVSRSIGDSDFKDEELPPEKQAVTCIPDILERDIKSADQYIVLACDGLWDVLNNQEVCDYVTEKISKNSGALTEASVTQIAEQLVNYAINDKKSPDNVTAVIVYFQRNKSKK